MVAARPVPRREPQARHARPAIEEEHRGYGRRGDDDHSVSLRAHPVQLDRSGDERREQADYLTAERPGGVAADATGRYPARGLCRQASTQPGDRIRGHQDNLRGEASGGRPAPALDYGWVNSYSALTRGYPVPTRSAIEPPAVARGRWRGDGRRAAGAGTPGRGSPAGQPPSRRHHQRNYQGARGPP